MKRIRKHGPYVIILAVLLGGLLGQLPFWTLFVAIIAYLVIKGRQEGQLSFWERVRGFFPYLWSIRWIVLFWVVANFLDSLSTFYALQMGASEGNPVQRDLISSSWIESSVYKYLGVFLILGLAGILRWTNGLKFLTVLMGLVVLSNFRVGLSFWVQPGLVTTGEESSTLVFYLSMLEKAVIAALLLWGRMSTVVLVREKIVDGFWGLRLKYDW